MKFEPMLPWYILVVLLVIIVAALVFCAISKKYRKAASYRRIAIALVMVAMLARPMVPNGTTTQVSNDIVLFFAVDTTASMEDTDINTSDSDADIKKCVEEDIGVDELGEYEDKKKRITGLKCDAMAIVHSFAGAHYSIVRQDRITYTYMPVSTDTDAALNAIASLRPAYQRQGTGTSLDELISKTDNNIRNYVEHHKNTKNIVIIMSDGADTKINDDNTYAKSEGTFAEVDAGFVIGYGDEKGSAKTEFNENHLNSIAKELGFSYLRHSSVEDIKNAINNFKQSMDQTIQNKGEKVQSYAELYWLFALLEMVLLLWEFKYSLTSILSELEVKS